MLLTTLLLDLDLISGGLWLMNLILFYGSQFYDFPPRVAVVARLRSLLPLTLISEPLILENNIASLAAEASILRKLFALESHKAVDSIFPHAIRSLL